jgi:transposase
MKPYSSELRDRIIRALESGEETPGTIAERFWVSLSFVEKLWQRFRRTGSSAATPHAGGKRRDLKDPTALRRREVEQHPDATLEAWRERLAAAPGPRVRSATSCRA